MDPLFTSLATAAAKATTSEIYSKVRTAKTNKNKEDYSVSSNMISVCK